MKFLSDRMTSASGSIGGTTFSHNRGGLYTRARRVPVNPRSAFQTTVRNNLGSLQALFPTLTGPQQEGWRVLADTMTFRGRLGNTFKMTAQQIFVAANAQLMQTGGTAVNTRPDSATRCPLNAAVLHANSMAAGGTSVGIYFDATEAWANDVNGLLIVWASQPQNPTKRFFAGPYRLMGTVAGAVVPPTSPATMVLPFNAGATGSPTFFRAVAILPPTYFPSSPIDFSLAAA